MKSEEHDRGAGPGPATARRALVIGYGNTLRGDDGAGPLVARIVDAWGLPSVRCIEAVQLTAELADDVGKHDLVFFVDAVSADACPEVRIDRLEASDRERTIAGAIGHAGDPFGILDMAEALHGKCPEAWIVAIPAHQFDLGEHLSTAMHEHVERAIFRMRHMLESQAGVKERSHA